MHQPVVAALCVVVWGAKKNPTPHFLGEGGGGSKRR